MLLRRLALALLAGGAWSSPVDAGLVRNRSIARILEAQAAGGGADPACGRPCRRTFGGWAAAATRAARSLSRHRRRPPRRRRRRSPPSASQSAWKGRAARCGAWLRATSSRGWGARAPAAARPPRRSRRS
jgi:hypothetical protein